MVLEVVIRWSPLSSPSDYLQMITSFLTSSITDSTHSFIYHSSFLFCLRYDYLFLSTLQCIGSTHKSDSSKTQVGLPVGCNWIESVSCMTDTFENWA